jgi:acyl carrier protein
MSTGLNAMPRDAGDEINATLRALLAETLGLSQARIAAFMPDTVLFGALPEFDSMAVANLLTGIEERFDVLIEDDDVEAEDFLTYGRLLAFIERLTNQ